MGQVIRFTTESSLVSQAVNVWHFNCDGAASTTLANECITKVDAFFEAIKSHMAPAVLTHGSRVTTVDLLPNVVVPATPLTTTTTGTNAGPYNVCAGVTWNTDFIGKSYRGRTYLGPLSQLAIGTSGTSIGASPVSDISTAATTLMAPTTGGATLCVWSEKLQTSNNVTGNVAHSGIRTQRRRLT